MAKMYPEWLPEDVKSNAERKVFRRLQKSLTDEYTVIWNIPWAIIRPQGGIKDGQIDFLILHPQKGLLTLEVKGGGIEYDSNKGKWISNGNNGPNPIKNPLEQAQACVHTLREELLSEKSSPKLRAVCQNCTFAYAIMFPDTSNERVNRIAERVIVRKELILSSDDLQPHEILPAIERIYTLHACNNRALGTEAIKEIVERYADSWCVYPLLSSQFKEEEIELKRLTENQFSTLRLLTHHKRAAIYGCAGTGKTFLAVEQARRLARRGKKVLLTCFNRNLSNWLEEQLEKQAQTDPRLHNIGVANFHRIERKLDSRIAFRDDEDRYIGYLLQWINQKNIRYDAVIVDEGQDFDNKKWEVLEALLGSEEGYLYIFYDNNQNIYQATPNYPVPLEHHCPLSDNCRTTKKIHEAIIQYYTTEGDDTPLCKGPIGRDIEFISAARDLSDEKIKVARLLKHLIEDEQVPIEDIVLLSPHKEDKSRFTDGLLLDGKYRLSWNMDRDAKSKSNTITCCTIKAFKGLERPVVILIEPEKISSFHDSEKLVYVALSRARLHLIILGNLYKSSVLQKLLK
jgi:hypothetical protein